jgi:aminobenzoyl-glutamate transport protein
VAQTGEAKSWLPEPIAIFAWLIGITVAASVLAEGLGLGLSDPSGARITAESLLSAENVRRLLVSVPATVTGFPPLGFIIVVMLGAGVAERSGLFAAIARTGVAAAPRRLLTPVVVLAGLRRTTWPTPPIW